MKKVVITGGSGFLGRRVASALVRRGDRVTVLTRDVGRARGKLPASVRAAAWTPGRDGPWTDEIAIADAIVHLAGEPVATRWTDKVKAEAERSRIDSTRFLVEVMGKGSKKPSVLVCASATGYYGEDRGDELLDEGSASGQGFLASLVKRWEEAAQGASAHGVRSVQLRIGVGLGEDGGALDRMIKPFRFFAGGHVGSGNQYISWVHRDDVAAMVLFAIDRDAATGPINLVAPSPATSRELAKAIGLVINRPSWIPAPKFALDLVLGEASSIVTGSLRVAPKRATELGFTFRYPHLIPALESILA